MPREVDLAGLRRRLPGRELHWLESAGSTMVEAARLAAAGCPSGVVVGAEEQTAGQGRLGRRWHSPPGAGLYVSIVLRLALPVEQLPVVTLALGLATAEAITEATGLAPDLRWPNDVLLGERKCAGILTQWAAGAVIAGIGINVNQVAFPPDIADVATSLALAAGRPLSREDLLVELLAAVDRLTRLLALEGKEPILTLFTRASSYAFGRRVVVEQPGRVLEGVTDGLTADGFLTIREAGGARNVIMAGGVRPAPES